MKYSLKIGISSAIGVTTGLATGLLLIQKSRKIADKSTPLSLILGLDMMAPAAGGFISGITMLGSLKALDYFFPDKQEKKYESSISDDGTQDSSKNSSASSYWQKKVKIEQKPGKLKNLYL